MSRIVISPSSPSNPSTASTSSPSSPAGGTRGSLRIRDNKADVVLNAAGRALAILDQLSDFVPSVPGLGLAAAAAHTLIDEAKSARRRRKDCEDLAEYASKSLQDVSRRLVDRAEWSPQVEDKMRELARVFIETSTRVREIGSAKRWRTLVMRDSFDAMVEGQRTELANAFHNFNAALNLDTNITVRETQKDVKALLSYRDKDELGYIRIQNHDIKHLEANTASKCGWYASTTNVHLAGHEGVVLCKEYHDLQMWRDDLRRLKKLRYARLPELLAYSAQADGSQLFTILNSVPRMNIQMWIIKTLSDRTIVQNVCLYYHGLRTLRDAAKYVQRQFELTDEQIVGVLEGLNDSDLVVDSDDCFLLTLPDVSKTNHAQCLWYLHKVGCPEDPSLCYPEPCAQFREIIRPMIRSVMVIFPEIGTLAHENCVMTRQRQFYDLIDSLSFALWERMSVRFQYPFQHLTRTYMTKQASEMSLRDLRKLASLGDMPWYQTEFTNVGVCNGVTHLSAGTYGWIPPHDLSHSHIRDLSWFKPLGHVQDLGVLPELLTLRRENFDVAIRLSSWGEPYPKVSLVHWRNSRPNRFRITVVARHKESVRFTSQADNNFWRLLAEQGASLANKHRDEHPLIESHDPVVVCCVESEFESELDIDLTDPQWSLVAADCHFKPILDFLERAPLEPAPNPHSDWLYTVVLGQECGHTEASGFSGAIAWNKDPEAKINWDDCDCVLVPQDVDLSPPPPETKLDCACDFCKESVSMWTMKKTWIAKLDREDYQQSQ